VDESGGSAQPRSGNDEPTEHATGATTPAADSGTPEPKHGDTPHNGAERPARRVEDPDTSSENHPKPTPPPEPATPDHSETPTASGATPTAHDDLPTRASGTPSAGPAPDEDPSAPASGTRSADSAPHDGPSAAVPGTPHTSPAPHADTDTATGTSDTGTAPHDTAHTDGPSGDRAPDRAHAHTDPHAPTASDARPAMPKGRPPQRPKEPGGGLLMGRPFGVPVYVAPSWFLVAALITWVFGGQLDRVLPELGAARYLVALFFAVAFYGSVLVHELAHTVAALRFKLPVRRIQLQFFGGVSEIEKEAETPGREFVLAFVGPLLSLILSGVFYLAMQPVEPGTVPGVLLAGLMVSNLIVAAFNLLPGLPLDGGRMLRAVVWKITGRPMTGTIAAAWVGRALAVSVLIGLPLLTQTGALGTNTEDISGMDTVTDALLAAILAAIIWTGAGNSLRMARLREHLPDLRARNLTRRAVPVETNTPLSEALRRANAAGARALVVVDADGQPLSLVREAAIVGVPEHRRPWVSVSGLAQDLTEGMRVSAELAGEDLLDTLRATPATEYLVVEETGEIYGVLSAADVERAFVKAMARPS